MLDYPRHGRFALNQMGDALQLLQFLLSQSDIWNCSEAVCREHGCFSCSMFRIQKEPAIKVDSRPVFTEKVDTVLLLHALNSVY